MAALKRIQKVRVDGVVGGGGGEGAVGVCARAYVSNAVMVAEAPVCRCLS